RLWESCGADQAPNKLHHDTPHHSRFQQVVASHGEQGGAARRPQLEETGDDHDFNFKVASSTYFSFRVEWGLNGGNRPPRNAMFVPPLDTGFTVNVITAL